MDAKIFDKEYKSKIWLIENYQGGWRTPTDEGFSITPGPSLEIKIIKTRIDSDKKYPGFYTLIIPKNISIYGTMKEISYLGTSKKLPLLREGDIIFGEAGFHKGRSIVLLDHIDRCTTNAHGLYARRKDGDISQSIYFRCIFDWYRTQRLIDLMAVGGSGGHFSPEYFDYVKIPRFPDNLKQEIVRLYHNTPTDFREHDDDRNSQLGIWELEKERNELALELNRIQAQIIEGEIVRI